LEEVTVLQGLRILDLTWILGGPFATQLLAQMGAEVIKIEPPDGDQSRTYPPYFFEGDSAYYLSVNRGKKSVVLDLKQAAAKEAFNTLVKNADAVMYGYAPDVPQRLGIDFETLRQINPKIVVGQLIGLHDQGPYRNMPAVDIIAQAMGGIMSITGEPDGKPVRVGYQIADLAAGLFLANGTLGGIVRALKSGAGSKVQVSLVDCQVALLSWYAQNYFVSGEVPRASGSRHPTIAPSEAFLCRDGRYIAVSGVADNFWKLLCEALGEPELFKDPRFASIDLRTKNVDALASELGKIFARAGADEWAFVLGQARIPSGKVNNVEEALQHPITLLRGMVEDLAHPLSGAAMRFLGNPLKHDGSALLSYPPRLGEHTREVLSEICGYDDNKLAALESAKAAFSAPGV
jgi:CoA:oxalate CoA-transferase